MRLAGSSGEQIAAAALYGPPPAGRLTAITQPKLVATGGAAEFYEAAADAVAASLPAAQRLTLGAQGHLVDPKTMAGVLCRFFSAGGSG